MDLQKRLAAKVLDCGVNRVRFSPAESEEIKKAITAFDIRRLVKKGIISKLSEKGVSRVRAKKRNIQRRKGRQSGHGSRKGTENARKSSKEKWVNSVRAQRALLERLREKSLITSETFKMLYRKVKGGYFRSINHIKIYLKDHKLIVGKDGKKQ